MNDQGYPYPGAQPSEPPAGEGTEHAAPNVERDERPMQPQIGGAPTPPELAHLAPDEGGYVNAEPFLMVGAHGPAVAELAHLLDDHGYTNKIAHGLAQPTLDDELMRIVQAFQDDNDIAPHKPQDGAPPLVPGRDRHSGVVDAKTWVALRRGEIRAVTVRYPEGSFA